MRELDDHRFLIHAVKVGTVERGYAVSALWASEHQFGRSRTHMPADLAGR
ncbi:MULTISPECIES: hypothetical protein [unclassified Streptomyces]|nr:MULTISPECIES: hypothetical protein [unclassified Streptomyces]WSC54830.1 hypothetical protein OG808_22580 [Streptomyces sp. NBC_01761]WSF85666.1 hypothetical protein OIE70_22675 [Streptomyces sp. NBC_01744]